MDKRDGGLLLTGDNGPQYSHSYFELQKRLQMSQGQNQIRGNLPPRTIGSSASPLIDKINGSHYDIALDAQEMRMVKLWIDASAHFIGTYAGLGSGMIGRYVENNVQRIDQQWASTQPATDAQNRVPHLAFQPDQIVDIPILPITAIHTAYYLRMSVDDRPGVMAEITRIMGDKEISIEAMLQKEPEAGVTRATIIMLTQKIREQQMVDAIEAITGLAAVHGQVHRIRVEALDGE